LKILLRSGTTIIEDTTELTRWKGIMMGPDTPINYSTDSYGLIIFRSSDIMEIRVNETDVEESMLD
jgi:hypothetical protein